MRVLPIVFLSLFCLSCATHSQEYEFSWESLTQHPDPEWFRDADIR